MHSLFWVFWCLHKQYGFFDHTQYGFLGGGFLPFSSASLGDVLYIGLDDFMVKPFTPFLFFGFFDPKF